MPTIEVAAQGTFPEKLMKLVLLDALLQHLMIEFEHYLFIKAETFTHCPCRSIVTRHQSKPNGLPFPYGLLFVQFIEFLPDSLGFLA